MGILFDGLAGIGLPLKKDLFELAPAVVKKRVAGIPVISILGAYSLIFIGSLLAEGLYNPAIQGPFGMSTFLVVVGTFVLGTIAYLSMKAYLKPKGIDISFAFKQIPPE